MNTSKKQLAISIISAVLLIASVSAGVYLSSAKSENKTPIEISKQQAPTLKVDIEFKNEGKELSYQGQAGKTALELLSAGTEVALNGSNENAYVVGIGEINADSSANEYWGFLVNGEMASVGAGSYITSDSDIISWKLSTF